MDYIEGVPRTDRLFDTFSEYERSTLLASLQRILTTLQSIPVHESARIGGLAGLSALLVHPSAACRPPTFKTESAMIEFLASSLADEYPTSPLCHQLRQLSTSHTWQFVHGDLAGRNLLVREGFLVAIVDWEWSGWYPQHLQAARAAREVCSRPSKVAELLLGLLPSFDEAEIEPLLGFYRKMEW